MRTGDHVLHKPTGETWVVAAVFPEQDRMAWCGYPEGLAVLSDCEVVYACTDAEHDGLLQSLAAIGGSDLRGAYARHMLQLGGGKQ